MELLWKNVRDRLHFVPGKWEFWRCNGCGSAKLLPAPRVEDLASFYPPIYDFTPDLLHKKNPLLRALAHCEYRWFFQPQYEAQAGQIRRVTGGKGKSGQRYLDVGCGGGLRLLAFRRFGYQVHGTDFRPQVVQYLREKLDIPAVCADATQITQHLPPDSFHLLTAFHLLEHVPDVQRILENCFQLLAPGGWFVGTVPLVNSLQARLLGPRWAGASEAPRHLSIPSPEGIQNIVRQVGFDRLLLQPDSLLNCTGVAVLSIFPSAGSRHSNSSSGLKWVTAGMTPLAAALLGVLAIPFCLAENYLFRQPAIGMIFARKPGNPV